MTFYTLHDLNIKLVDFINLLSPLGTVKKIVSNGDHHLVEIYFNNLLNIKLNNKENINNYINDTLLKLYFDEKMGYIINNKLCILELPKGIDSESKYLINAQGKDIKSISKYLRKNIPKDCINILKNHLILDKKTTDPDKINILNFNGYHKISV